jgi:hypothetical protein
MMAENECLDWTHIIRVSWTVLYVECWKWSSDTVKHEAPAGTTHGRWKGVFFHGGVQKWWQYWMGLDVEHLYHWSGLARTRCKRITGITSHHERQYSTKKSENGNHADIDAKRCQWMPVIMGEGTSNQERKTRSGAPSQNKRVQTTNRAQAETSVTSSTECQGITWNRNERSAALLGVYYHGP